METLYYNDLTPAWTGKANYNDYRSINKSLHSKKNYIR